MELNRRTKLAGGVLALAAAALLYDRVIAGGGPAEAGAAPVEKAAGPATPEEKAKPENPSNRGALATRLVALGQDDPTGLEPREDVFIAPAGWFPMEEASGVPVEPVAKASAGHVINSVMLEGKAVKFAVVDGKRLRPDVPLKFEQEGRVHTYELKRAWVDQDKVTHVELKVDGELLEIKRQPG